MQSNKLFGIGVMSALLFLMFLVYFFSVAHQNEEETVIKSQLEAIRENRFTEAYYAFTSKEFQKATSLDQFKRFIKNFPLFTEEYTLRFQPEDQQGNVKARLIGKENQMAVLFTLTKEDKDWHVKGIEIVQREANDVNAPDFNVGIFQKPIKDYMEMLKGGSVDQAYHELTSASFQEATSLEAFKAFLKEFPVFHTFKNLNFMKLTFNNNIGVYTVNLEGEDAMVYHLKYELIKEKGIWKILQIQLMDHPTDGE